MVFRVWVRLVYFACLFNWLQTLTIYPSLSEDYFPALLASCMFPRAYCLLNIFPHLLLGLWKTHFKTLANSYMFSRACYVTSYTISRVYHR